MAPGRLFFTQKPGKLTQFPKLVSEKRASAVECSRHARLTLAGAIFDEEAENGYLYGQH
jgi:hypothetical protein